MSKRFLSSYFDCKFQFERQIYKYWLALADSMPESIFPVYLRIFIYYFGSKSNRMLSEFEITNLKNRFHDFKFVITDYKYNIDLFSHEKKMLSQINEEFVYSIFSQFVRTNSITWYNEFLEFFILNWILYFKLWYSL